jgi:transcriptional regulator with XRE-family HTH domain
MKRIKQIREKREIKQETIAKELNITRGTYSHYETGNRKMPVETLKKICEYFDVTADYFLGLIDYPLTIAQNDFRKELENNATDLLDKFNLNIAGKSLTEKEAKVIIDLLNLLKEKNKEI